MSSTLVSFLALVGALALTTLAIVAVWWVYIYRPKPEATIREAFASIRWDYAIGVFILPPTIVGALDGPSPIAGFVVGFGFVLFIVSIQWWWGPI